MERSPSEIVYVVESDEALREEIRATLERANFAVRTFADADSLLECIPANPAGCLLAELDSSAGLRLQAVLAERGIRLPTIFVTAENCLETVVEAVRAGALNVMQRPVPAGELVRQLSGALEQSRARLRIDSKHDVYRRNLARLSRREREIMLRLASNQSNMRIASELGISPKTVGVHRARVIQKMQVDGVVELTKIAFRLGLVQ